MCVHACVRASVCEGEIVHFYVHSSGKMHLEGEGQGRLFNRIQIIGSLKILYMYIYEKERE